MVRRACRKIEWRCATRQQSSVGMVKQPVTLSLHEETETVVVTLEPQALMTFVNVEQRLSFPTLNTNDKIAWTEESDCMALVMDPVRVNNNKEAIVEFNKGANQLMLCVCTNGVDYDLMENVTMAVVEVSGVSVSEMVLGLQEEVTIDATALHMATDAFFVATEGRLADMTQCSNGERVSTIGMVQSGMTAVTITKPADVAQLCLVFPGSHGDGVRSSGACDLHGRAAAHLGAGDEQHAGDASSAQHACCGRLRGSERFGAVQRGDGGVAVRVVGGWRTCSSRTW